MRISFYDWCIENKMEELLDLWDYEKNDIDPKNIGRTSNKHIYFKCPRGLHESESHQLATVVKSKRVRCNKCASFGQWCLDNNCQDLLDRWDYELNDISPFEVKAQDNRKYYFRCPNNIKYHPSELKRLDNLVNQPGSRGCICCNSFGQWGIDNFGDDFIEKYWSDKNTVNPFSIPNYHNGMIWIKCQKVEYHDDYQIMANNFANGERCPYCRGLKVNYYDSLGYKRPDIADIWSNNNIKSPYELSLHSNQHSLFICDIHGEYKRKISDIVKMKMLCPYCARQKTTSSY